MPGMMDTVLNVGLDNTTFEFWADKLGKDCALDCRKRLSEMYSSTVLGLGKGFISQVPDAKSQLLNCIQAVFKSWNTERAKIYRKLHNIPDDWGTAVTVQAMVFGNYNEQSCSGVLFTRNPDTGQALITGEFLPNAQGEDVVAGTATPLRLEKMVGWNKAVYIELMGTVAKLEELKRDVQDVEFTVQDGKLYILQTRNAKRSAAAAIKIALDLYNENVITNVEAISRISAKEYDLSQLPVIDPTFKEKPTFTGIPACSGVVTGVVVLSAQAAIDCKEPCILVTQETTPDDIGGMIAAKGILTMTGGATSHAAVVARGMNKPCVVGLSQELKYFPDGQIISIDGATGRVWKGPVPVLAAESSEVLKAFKALLWSQVDAHQIDGEGANYITTTGTILLPEKDRIKAALKQVKATTGKVYVDCRYTATVTEASFLDCFLPYDHGTNYNAVQDDFALHLVDRIKETAPELLERVILVGYKSSLMGYVESVTDLNGLIMASGDVLLSINYLHQMIKKEVIAKVVSLKGNEISPMSVGYITTGAKSFISESQLIATLLNSK
jgi:pyruvate,orthophosphate dikinase